MIEYAILKALTKNREVFEKYYTTLKQHKNEPEIELILDVVGKYYARYLDHDYVGSEELKGYLNIVYPILKDKEKYTTIIDNVTNAEISDSLIKDYCQGYVEKSYASKMVDQLIPILEGSTTTGVLGIEALLEEFKQAIDATKDPDEYYVTDDLEVLLEEEAGDKGMQWPLKGLQEFLGRLNGSTLGHVFARPDTGKTTFIINCLRWFATQLGEDECVVWVNNEEKGRRLRLRFFGAVCRMLKIELMQNVDKAKKIFGAKGGDKVLLYDRASISIKDIEEIIKTQHPKIVVIDQGDKITFKGGKDMSNVDRLKALYVEFRELAKRYDVDIITCGQASADAHGAKWLQQIHMDNSKTGKPGELDYAIGIGKVEQDDDDFIRYIHIAKNKLHDGEHGRFTTLMDTGRASFEDF